MVIWQLPSQIPVPILRKTHNSAKICSALNPATFLPESLDKKQNYACYQVLALNYSAREGLKDKRLENPDETMFTDGFSFTGKGECKVGMQWSHYLKF